MSRPRGPGRRAGRALALAAALLCAAGAGALAAAPAAAAIPAPGSAPAAAAAPAAIPAPGSAPAAAVAADSLAGRAGHPARWWTPVPPESAASWEILPQAAGPGEVIVSKRQPDLGLLSNFAPTPFTFHGRRYASLEGFWQMMLYPEGPADPRARFPGLVWPHTRAQVAGMTAFEAKRAGQVAERNLERMGIGWVSFEGRRFPYRSARPGEHHRLIVEAMRQKVRQNPAVAEALLATGDLALRPDHHPEPDAPPEWDYCAILMALRADLRRERAAGEEDVLATAFRWLAATEQAAVLFVGLDGRDPPQPVVERLVDLHRRVRRRSEVQPGPEVRERGTLLRGTVLDVYRVEWRSPREAVLLASTYCGSQCGKAYRLTVTRGRSGWTVSKAQLRATM